jgi:hypothetical protein
MLLLLDAPIIMLCPVHGHVGKVYWLKNTAWNQRRVYMNDRAVFSTGKNLDPPASEVGEGKWHEVISSTTPCTCSPHDLQLGPGKADEVAILSF